MSNFRFDLNGAGVRELLQSSQMQSILAAEGAKVAARAGDGYSSAVHVHSKRAVANIFPDTKESARDNYENNTLLKDL